MNHFAFLLSSVKVEAHLIDDGGEACDVRFYYLRSPGGTRNYTSWRSGLVSGAWPESEITGLDPGTTYDWGVQARNSAGTYEDSGSSFTTLTALPYITAYSHTNITTNSVDVTARLIDDGGEACDVRFWAQPSAGGAMTYTDWRSGLYSGAYPEATLTGLNPNTQYNWGVEARNSAGTYEDSGDSFTTLVVNPPDISADICWAITTSSVKVVAHLIDDGGEACDVQFYYQPYAGGTVNYTSWKSGLFRHAWPESEITGLDPGTTYNWGVQARNSAGTDTDTGISFTTLVDTPDISAESRWGITTSSVKVKAYLRYDGGEACDVRFYYLRSPGGTRNYTSWKSGLFKGARPESEITGLDPGTTYDWGVQARNSAGTYEDSGSSFTTLTAPVEGETVTLYVDDNGPFDPGPSDPNISDPQEDGSSDHPFDSIQEAIDAAQDRDAVIVFEGVYYESIEFKGCNITVTGFDTNEPNNLLPYPVIDANYLNTAVTFHNQEEPNCILEGFVITRGEGDLAGGIYCNNSNPTITNCLIVGNRIIPPGDGGGAVSAYDSNAVFVNCTFSDNYGGENGAGLYFVDSKVIVMNSIISDNLPEDILTTEGDMSELDDNNFLGYLTETYPLFVSPGYWADLLDPEIPLDPNDPSAIWMDGDYHLMSEAGRWDPNGLTWITDDATSPCIDSGDPNSPVGEEPVPNGGRINQGAYGGTSQASKSVE